MGTFSNHQHTHPGIPYWSRPPPGVNPNMTSLLILIIIGLPNFRQVTQSKQREAFLPFMYTGIQTSSDVHSITMPVVPNRIKMAAMAPIIVGTFWAFSEEQKPVEFYSRQYYFGITILSKQCERRTVSSQSSSR